MLIYKKDKRFAIKERENGGVDVLVKDEFTGKYIVGYMLVDLQSAFQCIYNLTGKKEFLTENDFEEIE